ncbi:MAG TPA: FkbM family methyltransferase [Candidatus Binatia bacterium]|nr:FkbM family methyltransferase [Candidatus Binatia bacterium]
MGMIARLLGRKAVPQVELVYKAHRMVFEYNNPTEEIRTARYGLEKDILFQFLDRLRPDDVVLDIGASVGLLAVHSAKIASKVIAIEPDPETFSRLQRHVQINRLRNVECLPLALADTEGTVTLYSDGASGHAPSLRGEHPHAPKGTVTVRQTTVDKLFEGPGRPAPTVIKIDIEGAEYLCLKGAARILKGQPKPRLLLIEVHPTFLPQFGGKAEDVEPIMADLGYRAVSRTVREEQAHYFFEPVT